MIKVVVICGATAVGKTKLSVELAKCFNAEIVNADASQFKRNLNVGTAKIQEDEMEGVTHHLIDIIDEEDSFSIHEYQKLAREKVETIVSKGKNCFIVGGSGLYIDALINDYDLNGPSNDYIESEKEYALRSNEDLYNELLEMNPDFALHTHPNNRKRVIRYIQKAKEGLTFEKVKPDKYFDALILCLNRDRANLYERINNRTDAMIEGKWIEEVKILKEKGIDFDKVKEIGYREINDYLDNNISFEDLVNLIKQKTRNYAKRQITWFKNKFDSIMIDVDNVDYNYIKSLIEEFLK